MFGVALTFGAVYGQQAADTWKDPMAEADDKIIAKIHDRNEIMNNLEYLSDVIGARLAGTENLKKANDLDTPEIRGLRRGESAPGGLDCGAHVDASKRDRTNHQPVSSYANDRVVRLGAFHKWHGARPCGLCEGAHYA